jgi:hypothetical protein
VHNGDWAGYPTVRGDGARSFAARVSSAGSGGTIEIRSGAASGPLLGSVGVPVTGNWESFTTVFTPLSGTGTGPLLLRFTGGSGFLFDVDTFVLPGPRGPGQLTGKDGQCVGVRDGVSEDGKAIVMWSCNGNVDQKWTLPGDGTVRSMGKCLDVENFGKGNGSVTHLWTCHGDSNQIWVPQPNGTLLNPISGRCLDAPGTRLQLWDCHAGSNQRWKLP